MASKTSMENILFDGTYWFLMIMKEGLPEGLKLTYSWHFKSGSCSPCGGDVGTDESQGRSPVGMSP